MRKDRTRQILKAEERDFKSGKFDYTLEREDGLQVGNMELIRIRINKVYKGDKDKD